MIEILLAAAAQLAQPACPIDRQVYRLQADARFSAGFARLDPRLPNASDLAFWLKTPQRTYWFSFHAPNGYGGTIIMPDLDPEATASSLLEGWVQVPHGWPEKDALTIDFDAFRADLSVYEMPPRGDDPAPARLFARGLGSALWYNPAGLARDDKAQAESMPISMFEPAECLQGTQSTLQR